MSSCACRAMRKMPLESGSVEYFAWCVPSGKMQKGTLSRNTSTAFSIVSLFLRTSSMPSRIRMIGIIFKKVKILASLGLRKMSARAT